MFLTNLMSAFCAVYNILEISSWGVEERKGERNRVCDYYYAADSSNSSAWSGLLCLLKTV